MVLQSTWLAVGAFATLMTVAYLFRPRERVTFSSLFAGVGWAWMAFVAGNVETLAPGTGEAVSASEPSLQYVLTALALLSWTVTLLYRFDEYPPVRDDGLGGRGGGDE